MYEIVWDVRKAQTNFAKHGVRFSDAATVLDDPRAFTVEDRRFDEPRWITIGMDLSGHVCVVVYSFPGASQVRLISARSATRRERMHYVEA